MKKFKKINRYVLSLDKNTVSTMYFIDIFIFKCGYTVSALLLLPQAWHDN